ncbi:MAG: sigma-70 family RNA polymerase sigma factor [Thermomicrobiales bacterium]|nr:sigma-70 family RNA polymerase sigma factor [Thermomicrobiales bacterium]
MNHNGVDPSREDDAIVMAARDDVDAFAPLYQRYSGPIFRWMYRETGDVDIANDFTAQVFAQALQNLHRYQPRQSSSFRSWLFTIARNLLRDSWRRYRPTSLPMHMPDHRPGPEEIAIRRTEMDELRAAFSSLPARQREIVELRLTGLSMQEIADIQGTSVEAVRTAQTRAFKTLRALLTKEVAR